MDNNIPSYNNFVMCMKFIAKWEWSNRSDGGYTNDPADPGGETKWGISKRAHPDLDIKNLTPEQASEVYCNDYWVPSNAYTLNYPDSLCVFDAAVNNGVSRAKTWWSMQPFDATTFLDNRTLFYIQIVKKNPQEQKFLGGWLNRVGDLKKILDIKKDYQF